jgi:hypothetical protein
VFVFKRDDESCIQVGRSCMKDFLGYDPAAALWAASMMTVIDDEFDEPLGSFNHSDRISVDAILEASAYAGDHVCLFLIRKAGSPRLVGPL